MTPRFHAGYSPNGPTFPAPRERSDAVLSEGSNSARRQGSGRSPARHSPSGARSRISSCVSSSLASPTRMPTSSASTGPIEKRFRAHTCSTRWRGAGDHRRMARALQRNHATRCAGKPAASALPRAFARRGNSSLELSTRRGSLRIDRQGAEENGEVSCFRVTCPGF